MGSIAFLFRFVHLRFIWPFVIFALYLNGYCDKNDYLKNDPNWQSFVSGAVEFGKLFGIPSEVLTGHFIGKYKKYDCLSYIDELGGQNGDTSFYYNLDHGIILHFVKSTRFAPDRFKLIVPSSKIDKILGILTRAGFTGDADWRYGELVKNNVSVYYGKREILPTGKCLKNEFRLYPYWVFVSPINYPKKHQADSTSRQDAARNKRSCALDTVNQINKVFAEVFGRNIKDVLITIIPSPKVDKSLINGLTKDTIKYALSQSATLRDNNKDFWISLLYNHVSSIKLYPPDTTTTPIFICGCQPHSYEISVEFTNRLKASFVVNKCSITFESAFTTFNNNHYKICFDEKGISLLREYLVNLRTGIFKDTKGCCGD